MTTPPVLRPRLSLKTLRVHRQDSVLFIELSTPEPGNVVTDAMLDDLWAVLAHQEPDVRVLVLSGAGDDFCVGGDRTEFAEHLGEDPTGGGVRISGVKARRVSEALTSNPAVTVARVHGKVIGAGFALALACDLRVGAEDASFRLPELAFGLPMAWGGLLPRLLNEVGAARARELVLTGRAFDAQEALSLSILHKAVPAEGLDAAVTAWAKPITRRPPAALRVTKTLLNSYAAATRLADLSGLDAELMAAVVAENGRKGVGH
ncbi:enoyl-CoA hydratase/isomerase family protein [Streptomyces sp. NPDC005263]|uniref:enoyl-CoA hydratase/isomerase family protein n=1 Tax=Streptomyces sp. NPDC005263 TaxID=3364711 RepID=UPI00369FAAF2